VGFTIATILFSVLNYASTGYTLQAAYLSDPRPTTWPGMDSWYKNWPASLVGGNKPSCQPASIPIGSTLFTNNGALLWTVDDVALLSNGTTKAMPSFVYQGDELTDCELLMITISAHIAAEPGEVSTYMGAWQTKLEGKVYCRVYKPSLGSIQVNLTSTWTFWKYEVNGNGIRLRFSDFLGRDETYSSLLWAESLLRMDYFYFILPLNTVEKAGRLSDLNYTGVTMRFARNPKSTTTTADIRSQRFFDIGVQVRNNSHQNHVLYWEALYTEPELENFVVDDAVAMENTPNIWEQANNLSKAFLSTMWTDLGQVSATPNIFSDPDLLQHFGTVMSQASFLDGLPDGEYKPSPENDTLLGVRPSVLATNYLCQVPRRKPWGSLIIAILVADLVLLRALWTVVGFVSTYFAKRRNPLANTCETSAKSLREAADSSDEQSFSTSGSAMELENLNSGDSVAGRSRNPSLNESLLSRSSGSLRR
jgi:hypothetical protein